MKADKYTGIIAPLEGVEVRRSRIHGLGVFALRDFCAGDEVGLYAGRRYAPGEHHDGWNDQLTYLFGLSDGSTIDGAQDGNVTRHINHACTPNVEAVERYAGNGELELAICAIHRLVAGQELFLDYALAVDSQDAADFPCECGAAECTGTMAALAAKPALPSAQAPANSVFTHAGEPEILTCCDWRCVRSS